MTTRILLPIALLAGLAGCSEYEKIYQPAEYHPVTEMKPGAGLLTGESGVFRLYGGNKDDSNASADGPPLGDDEEVIGKPGEPIIVKRHRKDAD